MNKVLKIRCIVLYLILCISILSLQKINGLMEEKKEVNKILERGQGKNVNEVISVNSIEICKEVQQQENYLLEEIIKDKKIEEKMEDEIMDEELNSYTSLRDFIAFDVPLEVQTQEYIYELSKEYNIDFALVIAVIECESGYNPDIINFCNCYGLMQINQCNHNWLSNTLGVNDFLDEKQNVLCGIYILSQFLNKYGDVHVALMAYNCGEGGASEYWNQGIYTSYYSEKITSRAQEFRNIYY